MMDINRKLLIHCLLCRHDFDLHEDDEGDLMSLEEYLEELKPMSLEQLIEETECDDKLFPLDRFLKFWNYDAHWIRELTSDLPDSAC